MHWASGGHTNREHHSAPEIHSARDLHAALDHSVPPDTRQLDPAAQPRHEQRLGKDHPLHFAQIDRLIGSVDQRRRILSAHEDHLRMRRDLLKRGNERDAAAFA